MRSEDKTTGFSITRIDDRFGTEFKLTRYYKKKGWFGHKGSETVGWYRSEGEAIQAMKANADPRYCTSYYNADGTQEVGW